MGNLFRSEEMHLLQLFIQTEAAKATVEVLGKTGLVQFVDLNASVSAHQRAYVGEVKRCEELERKLAFIAELIVRHDLSVRPPRSSLAPGERPTDASPLRSRPVNIRQTYGSISVSLQDVGDGPDAPVNLDDLELHLASVDTQLRDLMANGEVLTRSLNELTELRALLDGTADFFEADSLPLDDDAGDAASSVARSLLAPESRSVSFVAGLCESELAPRLERILWRATRGNLIFRRALETLVVRNSASGKPVSKTVFLVFMQGDRTRVKIRKVLEAYGASLYDVPDTGAARAALLRDVKVRATALQATVDSADVHMRRVLRDLADSVADWREAVTKEKAIAHELNKFKVDVSAKALIAECWAPTWADPQVRLALDEGVVNSGAPVQSFFNEKHTRATPPTYFQTSKYTAGFQAIVDAYGMANYGEANPGVFTIITFPFLFGVMFGDLGHGFLVTLFAAMLIWKERKLAASGAPEMFFTIFNGRYLIFLMGLFAMYAGLLYNDCFSLSLDLFGTNWSLPAGNDGDASLRNPARVYPFGVDPGWAGAANKLTFLNSVKMKMSIILGVCQMLFGICLSLTNHLHKRDYLAVLCEFIPQVLFLLSMFGYMVFLIVLKWVANPSDPPLILGVIIDMFLKAPSLQPKDRMFAGQAAVQNVLLLLLFICPPWMLIPKPLVIYIRRKMRTHSVVPLHQLDSDDERATASINSPADASAAGAAVAGSSAATPALEAGHGAHDEEPFGEIIVHQVIHTIEFVLGTVSNTASYLRLWALSLAHAELSEVIWDQLFARTFGMGNPVFIFVGFAIWAGATFGILMVMESLSAFLHALRLHWVEWQNKFFVGAGVRFVPFKLNSLSLASSA